jgi:hypothetical protein
MTYIPEPAGAVHPQVGIGEIGVAQHRGGFLGTVTLTVALRALIGRIR